MVENWTRKTPDSDQYVNGEEQMLSSRARLTEVVKSKAILFVCFGNPAPRTSSDEVLLSERQVSTYTIVIIECLPYL